MATRILHHYIHRYRPLSIVWTGWDLGLRFNRFRTVFGTYHYVVRLGPVHIAYLDCR